jgi:sterol desaturase/sphingolipid hydroxylase (fatty acid hydroxylase superfamily)
MDSLLANEPLIRLAVFVGVLALMAGLEAFFPRRQRAAGRWLRWPNNLGVVVVDSLIVRILFPTAAVGIALAMEGRGVGLLPWLGMPQPLAILLAIVVLDFAIYL